jgi:hypothetical protein
MPAYSSETRGRAAVPPLAIEGHPIFRNDAPSKGRLPSQKTNQLHLASEKNICDMLLKDFETKLYNC